MGWVIGSAVKRLAELNGSHAFTYSAAELTKMVNEALAEQRSADE